MVRVGVPAELDPSLFAEFPREAEIVRLPAAPEHEYEVDFWIPPLHPAETGQIARCLRGVQVVQSLWAGVDAMLSFVPPGAVLCDGQGIHDLPVAEYVVAVILATFKYLPFFVHLQETGDWRKRREAEQLYRAAHPDGTPGGVPALEEELSGSTVLIVGYGAIGSAVEERLRPFGVKMLRVARHAREGVEPIERLDALLGEADVVVVLVPLTDDTRGLFNRERLAKLKHGALLVNVARGPVVDTEALLQELQAGRMRAVLDVTDPEPLPLGHPLWSAPNVLITPHVAGSSPTFLGRALQLAADQVRRFVAGEPLHNVVKDGY